MNFKKFELEIVRNLCFDNIIKFEDSDFDILTDEKSYENILNYDILYRTLISAKSWCIRFSKVNGFFRVYDGTSICSLKSWCQLQ